MNIGPINRQAIIYSLSHVGTAWGIGLRFRISVLGFFSLSAIAISGIRRIVGVPGCQISSELLGVGVSRNHKHSTRFVGIAAFIYRA